MAEIAGGTGEPVPASYGPIQAARRLGIAGWQFDAALVAGVLGPPGMDGRWPGAEIEAVAAGDGLAQLVAEIGDLAPIGANRAAQRIGEQLGVDAAGEDVDDLAERGLLAEAGEYKGWPLYAVPDLDRVAAEHADLIGQLVAERLDWMNASVHPADAARDLGWSTRELHAVAARQGLSVGRFGRYARHDVQGLAGDAEAAALVQADRRLGPERAATRLGVRRVDFDHCVTAGWIAPVDWTDTKIGPGNWVQVPLYRAGDVDALLQQHGIDWDAVRATQAGKPSLLLPYAVAARADQPDGSRESGESGS